MYTYCIQATLFTLLTCIYTHSRLISPKPYSLIPCCIVNSECLSAFGTRSNICYYQTPKIVHATFADRYEIKNKPKFYLDIIPEYKIDDNWFQEEFVKCLEIVKLKNLTTIKVQWKKIQESIVPLSSLTSFKISWVLNLDKITTSFEIS